MSLAGLVLAAGEGARFGRPKALVPFGGEPLVARAEQMLSAAGCEPVVVVLGAAADEVRRAVDLPYAVVNPDWAQGMGSSLRCGLAALPGDAAAVVVALADQPLVGKDAVVRLAAAWRQGAVAAAATYGGQPRNPVLLARAVWPDVIKSLAGDTGAGPWLRAHPEQVTMVDCDGTGSPYDIDTPDDLLAVTNMEEKTHAPRPRVHRAGPH